MLLYPSDCTRSNLRAPKMPHFPLRACPQTSLVSALTRACTDTHRPLVLAELRACSNIIYLNHLAKFNGRQMIPLYGKKNCLAAEREKSSSQIVGMCVTDLVIFPTHPPPPPPPPTPTPTHPPTCPCALGMYMYLGIFILRICARRR